MDTDSSAVLLGNTGSSATLLANGDVLLYGNDLPSYTSQFYNPAANIWSRTQGNNGTGVNFGPLVTLTNGNALLAGGTVVYSGNSNPTREPRFTTRLQIRGALPAA